MKYIIYRTDGTREILNKEKPLTYEELRELVGGMIEYASAYEGRITEDEQICLNEEGLINNLPINPFFTPMHQENYHGNIVQGYTNEQGEFMGFEDEIKYLHEVKKINPLLFQEGKIFTIIQISEWMAHTTKGIVKSVGKAYGTKGDKPAFKENKKGARKTFLLRNLEDKDVLIFEGSELPFKLDGEVKNQDGVFTSSTIRGNALFNFHGDPNTIREWVKTKNLNPFFTAYDRVNHVDEKGKETLLFMDRFASCKLVADRQEKQLKEQGYGVSVGVGYQIRNIEK